MSANDILNQNEIRAEMVRAVQNHWAFYPAEGIVLFALGVITIIVPPIATLGVTIVIGWLFFTSGAFSLIMSFFARRARGYPTRRASERKCSQYAHPTLSPPLSGFALRPVRPRDRPFFCNQSAGGRRW